MLQQDMQSKCNICQDTNQLKSAEFTLVVDKDGLLKTIDVIESYSMKVGIISASCSSNFTTYFTKINSINEISKDQRDSYAEMLAAYR